MRVLLSTIGSRGDVQPLVALALELRAAGQDVHMCVPPDFREWIEGLGISVTPIGPEVRATARGKLPETGATATPRITPELRRQMIEGTIVAQFQTIGAAAKGCDMIVGATALQIAAPSVAERAGIPYAFAAYCPAVLPSPRHAPPVLALLGEVPAAPMSDYSALWAKDAQRWNDMWAPALNAQRAALGLGPIDDVRSYVLTDRPWLAADPTLAPWAGGGDDGVFQPGAWIVPDDRPLAPELSAFLDAGEPPIYFGFGSNRAPEDLARTMIESARALGRRAIVSRGWAALALMDDVRDCIAIGDANFEALFPRVSAVVHHGGAGTTTAAARAGAPQVVIAQHYDQHYWAQRVEQLGVGVAHDGITPTAESLTNALRRALRAEVHARARSVSREVRADGARIAARRVMDTMLAKSV